MAKQKRGSSRSHNSRQGGDHYTALAKKKGYPARSVFKLEEMDKKDHLIPRKGQVLDVGAAPGSWSLYALRHMDREGQLTAVDLQELKLSADERLQFYQGDVFSPEAGDFLARRGPYDLIMSDAAPATTGNRTLDTARSAELCSGIIELAARHCRPGGNFVIKIFQGGDEPILFQRIRDLFLKAKRFTPKAVRSESFETYLIGLGRRENLEEIQSPTEEE